MNSEEMEHSANSGKRENKPTAKAMVAKIEAIQRDRKSKVNKVKNVIVSMKELMKCNYNASQVCSMLETILRLMDDASVLHRNLIPLLPPEEQTKQIEWFDSVSKCYNVFVKDVEQWMTETGKWCNISVSNAQAIDTNSAQGNENPCIVPSDTLKHRIVESDATSQYICESDVAPSVEVVSTTYKTRLDAGLQNEMCSGN